MHASHASAQPNVCPTDSRLRQDMQELEKAVMDLASAKKHKLEVTALARRMTHLSLFQELQRKQRKLREQTGVRE